MKLFKQILSTVALAAMTCPLVTSCQNVEVEDSNVQNPIGNRVSLQFNITHLELIPFYGSGVTRATNVAETCNKLSLAVYQNDKLVANQHQTSQDEKFGTMDVQLERGTYRIVVIAHNGEKAPVMTTASKITFDKKITDTFYYSEEINLDKDSTCNLTLKHAVAMFRLKIQDAIPTQVTRMRFNYTGGSSAFDAIKGTGSTIETSQTEFKEITSEMHGKGNTFEVYTFPKEEESILEKMTVTAYNSSATTIKEHNFSNVKIRRNYISQYEGEFFAAGTKALEFAINLTCPEEWGLSEYNF